MAVKMESEHLEHVRSLDIVAVYQVFEYLQRTAIDTQGFEYSLSGSKDCQDTLQHTEYSVFCVTRNETFQFTKPYWFFLLAT